MLVLPLEEGVQLHPLEGFPSGVDALQHGGDRLVGTGDLTERGIAEVVQGDLDLAQRSASQPGQVPWHQCSVGDEAERGVRGGELAHPLQHGPCQRGSQGFATGEVHAAHSGGDHGADDLDVVLGAQAPLAGLPCAVVQGGAWGHIALVVAEPAEDVAAGAEGDAELAAQGREIGQCGGVQEPFG